MNIKRFGFLLILLVFPICLMIAASVMAGQVGKISGVVTDDKGDPIPGATVMVDKTSMGAAASFDGSYVILNVPPGTYTLVAQTVGYNKLTVEKVEVSADITTEQNFKLTSNAIKIEDVTVVATRKAIDKYITQNDVRMSADQIKNMPVTNVSDVLKLSSGFVKSGGVFHARGGRGNEISYMVDGVEMRDVFGGQGMSLRSVVDISANDVQEMSVLKGNFDAEYGGVSSAIVNIVRKDGDNKVTTGRYEFLTDDFGFKDLNKYSFNQDRMEWNLSGPIPAISDQLFPSLGMKWPGEKMAYFMSFTVDKSNEYLDYNNYPSPKSKMNYGYEKFLGMKIPNRRSNQYSATGKLNWKMDANSKYIFSFSYSKQWQTLTGFNWRFLYTPQTAPSIYESKETYGANLKFTPDFLRNTVGNLKVNYFIQDYRQKPGTLTPGDFLNANNYESFADRNNNGQWDPGEPYLDTNGDGFFGEPYVDSNADGVYTPGIDEFFPDSTINGRRVFDLNGNGRYDGDIGAPYTDLNGNGRWDPPEAISNDQFFFDHDHNGQFNEGDSAYQVSGHGNGVFDPGLRDVINEDNAEPFTDGDVIIGEQFIDVDGDGVFTGYPNNPTGPDYWNGLWDLNNNGRYDGPSDPWTPGIPYRDLNNNGRYDPPNGLYDYGEPYADMNGNGHWDGKDRFWDYGFDQWALYERSQSAISTLGLDIISQVSKQHEIKSGIEFRDMKLSRAQLQYPEYTYDGTADGGQWPDRGVFRDFYTRRPKQGSFYFQDNMEYGEMIAHIGFRWDFFIQANEINNAALQSENLANKQIFDSRSKFSPRIAFSFPVTDKAKLYFNYGHFYQLPEFQNFYRRATQASSAAGIIGNPNLDFSKTIQYELGVQYSLPLGYILSVSGFYKDYYGLLNSIRQSYGPISTDIYSNVDYGRARGLELQIEKKVSTFFAGSVDYEYTWAYGKNSTESADYFARFLRQEIPLQERPLDWDIRHQLKVTGDIRASKGNHQKIGIFTLPDDWALNFIWQYKSGKPFTPDVKYPGLVIVTKEPLTNSMRMPGYSNFDVRFDKNFQIWKLNYTVSFRVNNLFDTKNPNGVYATTGLPYTSQNENRRIQTGTAIDMDPALFEAGRQVIISLAMNF